MSPLGECDRDPPDKPSTQKRVRDALNTLSLALDLAGCSLQIFNQAELAQVLLLSSAIVRSALLTGFRLRR